MKWTLSTFCCYTFYEGNEKEQLEPSAERNIKPLNYELVYLKNIDYNFNFSFYYSFGVGCGVWLLVDWLIFWIEE